MKLLTFLGVGKYEETEYVWQGKNQITRYAPVASAAFLQASEMVIFATEEAEAQHKDSLEVSLKESLGDQVNIPLQYIRIEKGETEAELWNIFSQVACAVERGENIAFDVTHGLRSFPLLGLLAAAYLRTALDVKLAAVLYGAYDVRNQNVNPHRTPMFDLTPLLSLLEWAMAADRFNRTGDSRGLASLLRAAEKSPSRKQRGAASAPSNQVEALAVSLENISHSLNLLRPYQVMQEVSALPKAIDEALPLLSQYDVTLPFRLLLETTQQAYQNLALPDPQQDARENLEIQRRLIGWYAEREHWMQAISLAREWLLSYVMVHEGVYDISDTEKRKRFENRINDEADAMIKQKDKYKPYCLSSVPDVKKVLGIWKGIVEVRNDIDHAGMRKNPEKPASLIKSIKKYVEKINAMPL